HKTEKPPKGRQGNLHAPHGQARTPEPVRHAIVGQTGLSWSPLSGQAFGHSLHAFHYLLGHHPQADGRVHSPASKHQGHTRRGYTAEESVRWDAAAGRHYRS